MTLGTSNACRVRREIRTCRHPACGKKFEGSPTSLYCTDHRTRKSRAERFIPKKLVKPEENNLIVDAPDAAPSTKILVCALPHCHKEYTFTVYPDHKIYPMYCELHRTEFKRRFFLKMVSAGKTVNYEPPAYEKWNDYEMQFEKYALDQPQLSPFPVRNRRINSKDQEPPAEKDWTPVA